MQATFPHLALWQDVTFHLSGQSLDPAESISGAQTIVPTLRGKWMATASFVLRGEAATLQWQAFLAQMQGRIGTTLVPARSRYRPKDANGLPLPFCDIANLRGAQTWQHFGFENTDVARITLAASAALRATELSLNLPASTGLRPGQFFSIGNRLHRVQHHWQPDRHFRHQPDHFLDFPRSDGLLDIAHAEEQQRFRERVKTENHHARRIRNRRADARAGDD